MRKFLTIILTVLTVICLGLVVGCSDKPCTSHTYNDSGKCTNCGHVCIHAEWTDGVCDECALICGHTGGTATCTAKKACTVCGKEYGDFDLSNHAQSAIWVKDADSHRQYYPCCDADIVAESEHTWVDGVCSVDGCDYACEHTGGTATCTAKKECSECGEDYGEFDLTNHTQSATWIKDADSHRQYYPCCNTDIVAESEHTWVDGVCSVDGCDYACEHTGGTATCTAKKECSECGEEYGEFDLTNHAQSATWIKDAGGHRQYYPCCDADIIAQTAHVFNNGVCAESGCEYTCLHESYTDGDCDACDVTCAHDSWTDGVCDECGLVCKHTEYENCACKECGKEKAHEYNATELCSGCGVAKNAINWVEHSTSNAKLTETTFGGINVLSYKTVTNNAEYNRIKATVTDEFDFIVFDFYILEGCVGQTNETTNSGLRFNWSLSGVSGYLLGDTTYYKDGVIFSNKMTNSTAYYALQVNTWYTAVIDISAKLPEEGQTRTLEFWANALASWTGEIYLKASRFTNERPMFWRYDVENQKAAASLTYSETVSEKTLSYACDGSMSADWADLEIYLTKNGTLSTQFRITEATKTTATTAYKFQIFSNDSRATVVAKCYDESGKEVTMDESGIELNKWYTLVIDAELNEGQTWAYVTWRANSGTTPVIKMDMKNVVYAYPTAA